MHRFATILTITGLCTLLLTSPALLAAEDWPAWRGPTASGVGPDSGSQLVDDLNQAKLVWRSEQRHIPSNGWTNGTQGGYDSPIVADSKVFLAYNQGAGDILAKNKEYQGKKWSGRFAKMDERKRKEILAIAANDTLLCVDAKTGKTRWKVILGEGINLFSRGKEGPHNGACWQDHKVYAQSSLGVVYCLDDETGKVLWQAETPATKRLREILEAYKRTGYRHPYRGYAHESLKDVPKIPLMMTPLQVVDGVVVSGGGRGLIAFDIKTGKELWQGGISGRGAPLPWSVDGKHFLLAGNACLEARTGKVVWEAEGVNGHGTFTQGEGYLIHSQAEKPKALMCFKMSPTGAEYLWTRGGDEGLTLHGGTELIMNGYVWLAAGRGAPANKCRSKFFAVELATGKIVGPIDWPEICQCQSSSVVAMDGRIFGQAWPDGSGNGTMYMVNGDPKDMRYMGELGDFDYAQATTPAVANGFMYIRGADSLYCYDLRSQK